MRAPRPWSGSVSLAFIVLALIALVVVPLVGQRHTAAFHQEMRTVAEPARGLVTDIHLALAIQGDALQDFLRSGDTTSLTRYRFMAQRERVAYQRLEPMTARLGEDVRQRFDTLRARAASWHAVADDALLGSDGGMLLSASMRRAVMQTDLFEEVLVAAAQLDAALTSASQLRRRQIVSAERLEVALAAGLAGVALAAVAMVALIGRQLRVAVAEAERQRKEIERLMEAKARLMRGLTHDLKNPLNAIYGHAQLLDDGIFGEINQSQRKSIAHVRRSVRALLGLLDDLLQLWRAEVGDLSIALQLTDVGSIVRDTAESYRAVAERAGHHVHVDIAENLPHLWTDVARLRQVLGNLIVNAVKYTPTGGRISVIASERPGEIVAREARWIGIDVADSGRGIAPEKLDAIFEEFTRLEPHGTPGAGLGLAISRRIARLLGGDVTVKSDVGHGSTFTLWLPIARRHDDREELRSTTAGSDQRFRRVISRTA